MLSNESRARTIHPPVFSEDVTAPGNLDRHSTQNIVATQWISGPEKHRLEELPVIQAMTVMIPAPLQMISWFQVDY